MGTEQEAWRHGEGRERGTVERRDAEGKERRRERNERNKSPALRRSLLLRVSALIRLFSPPPPCLRVSCSGPSDSPLLRAESAAMYASQKDRCCYYSAPPGTPKHPPADACRPGRGSSVCWRSACAIWAVREKSCDFREQPRPEVAHGNLIPCAAGKWRTRDRGAQRRRGVG